MTALHVFWLVDFSASKSFDETLRRSMMFFGGEYPADSISEALTAYRRHMLNPAVGQDAIYQPLGHANGVFGTFMKPAPNLRQTLPGTAISEGFALGTD